MGSARSNRSIDVAFQLSPIPRRRRAIMAANLTFEIGVAIQAIEIELEHLLAFLHGNS